MLAIITAIITFVLTFGLLFTLETIAGTDRTPLLNVICSLGSSILVYVLIALFA